MGLIPILVRSGYFSFFDSQNLLAASFSIHYNLIYGANEVVSLATTRLVRAAVVLFENSRSRTDLAVLR